jgi:hypothetical protein
MGGCLAKVYYKVLPSGDPRQNDPVCSRSDLSSWENDLFASLKTVTRPIAVCFLINVGLAVYIHFNSETPGEVVALIPNILATLSVVPQIKMTREIAMTDSGLNLSGLQVYRLSLHFFVLLNVVRLYDTNSTLNLKCSLSREAYEDANDHTSGNECFPAVSLVSMLSILVYIIFSLMQVAVVQKLEVYFHARNITKMWQRRVVEGQPSSFRRGGGGFEEREAINIGLNMEVGDVEAVNGDNLL